MANMNLSVSDSGIYTEYKELPLSIVDPDPDQPRKDFDERDIVKLSKSIREFTLLQAVTVRAHPTVSGRYMIIAGEQRFHAMIYADVEKATFKVLSGPGLARSYVLSSIENLQRRSLNPIDEARCLKRLHDDEKMTWEEIKEMLGLDLATMINKVKLLELPDEIIEMVRRGTLPQVTALNLSQWRSSEGDYMRMAHDLIAGRNPAAVHFRDRTALGDRQVQARLPKTPEDFAVRIVKLSGSVQSMPDVIQAFVMLSDEDQQRVFECINASTLGKLRIRFASLV